MLKKPTCEWSVLGLVVAACLILGGCAGSTGPSEANSDGGAYFFKRAEAVSRATSALGPSTLIESLPNRISTYGEGEARVGVTFSDDIVVGTVAKVDRSEAVAYDVTKLVNDEPQARIVDWDDPVADERSLIVTLTGVRSLSGSSIASEVRFRLGVLDGAKPEDFQRSFESLESVVVLLEQRPDGRHKGEWISALGPAGIGVVADDGSLRFPGMGDREEVFADGVDSVSKLEKAESAPPAD